MVGEEKFRFGNVITAAAREQLVGDVPSKVNAHLCAGSEDARTCITCPLLRRMLLVKVSIEHLLLLKGG